MTEDPSEEKTLPPSDRKLRKAREKGQVLQSREVATGAAGIVAIGWLYWQGDRMAPRFAALFAPDRIEGDFATVLEERVAVLTALAVDILVPFLALVIVVAILANLAVMGGPLFSVHPLAPDFQKVNPASGVKRIFGRRAMVSFLVNLLRLTLFTLATLMVLAGVWSTLMRAPVCGFGCAAPTILAAMLPLLIAFALLMLAFLFLDYLVQRALFLHEMRMSITERKRERKDMEGDPLLRQQLRRDRRDLAAGSSTTDATLVIDGGGYAVAIRYVEGDTPAPMVVGRAGSPEMVGRLLDRTDCPTVTDANLAPALYRGLATGAYVTRDEHILPLVRHIGASKPGSLPAGTGTSRGPPEPDRQ